jgi:hypothetical protein
VEHEIYNVEIVLTQLTVIALRRQRHLNRDREIWIDRHEYSEIVTVHVEVDMRYGVMQGDRDIHIYKKRDRDRGKLTFKKRAVTLQNNTVSY